MKQIHKMNAEHNQSMDTYKDLCIYETNFIIIAAKIIYILTGIVIQRAHQKDY